MTFAAAIYAHLAGDAGIVAIASTRVYPVYAPQLEAGFVMPATVVFRMSSRRSTKALSSLVVSKPTTWEIVALADDYDESHALADAIEAAMTPGGYSFRGVMGGASGVTVKSSVLSNQWDAPENEEQPRGFYATVSEFEIEFAI